MINKDTAMKKLLLISLLLFGSISFYAQDVVNFEFSGGIGNGALKTKMERQVSNLLTAINRAETYNTDINYTGIDIDPLASQSIGMMWNNVHMRTQENYISEVCMRDNTSKGNLNGYQVRNIAVQMVPISADYDEDLKQEICIYFDKSGTITDFNITLGKNQWKTIIEESTLSDDLDKRLQILHWTEQFRMAYCQKDITFLEKVFGDDVLVITDKAVKPIAYSNETPKVAEGAMDNQRYMNILRKVFKRNAYVNVQFDEIEISRHCVNPNIYGVTLGQNWNSDVYSDSGWLFVIWDFSNDCNPQILCRVWQNKADFTREQVFSLDDFDGLVGDK